jgi:hypothetical protein
LTEIKEKPKEDTQAVVIQYQNHHDDTTIKLKSKPDLKRILKEAPPV